MNKFKLIFIVLVVFFYSCDRKEYINISTKTANGIKVGTPIVYKGIQVGKVKDYSFLNGNVVLKVNIDKQLLPLTRHYQFDLRNINSFDVGIILTINDTIDNKLDAKTSTLYCDLEFPKIDIKTLDSIAIEGNMKVIDHFEKKIDSILTKTGQSK